VAAGQAIGFGRWWCQQGAGLVVSRRRPQDQFGRQGEEEASHQSQERDLPGETAADGQDLADDVEQWTWGATSCLAGGYGDNGPRAKLLAGGGVHPQLADHQEAYVPDDGVPPRFLGGIRRTRRAGRPTGREVNVSGQAHRSQHGEVRARVVAAVEAGRATRLEVAGKLLGNRVAGDRSAPRGSESGPLSWDDGWWARQGLNL
jgi:hypothetical protein